MDRSALLVRLRFVLQAGFDSVCWIVAITLATLLRYDFQWARVHVVATVVAALASALIHVAVGRFATPTGASN